MFYAMNRFRIIPGAEQDFIEIWKNRESHLCDASGFISFNLLQGESDEQAVKFISHSCWESKEDFINWTKSEAFAKAHNRAGQKTQNIYLGPPVFEGYKSVLEK